MKIIGYDFNCLDIFKRLFVSYKNVIYLYSTTKRLGYAKRH